MINNLIFNTLLPLLTAYLIGSIPIGYLISLFLNDDIRKHGSGNIGSTNMTRTYGKKIGKITFIGDVLKGILVYVIFNYIWHVNLETYVFTQFMVVFGHCFSIFLKFKGGKGVATSVAIAVFNNPYFGIITILTWLLIFKFSKMVSLASMISLFVGSLTALIWIIFNHNLFYYVVISMINTIIVIYVHKENIGRILNNTEYRFKNKTK